MNYSDIEIDDLIKNEIGKGNPFIGELNHHSIGIKLVYKLLRNQLLQGNPINILVFQQKFNASRTQGGFTWDKSEEGFNFWRDIDNQRRGINPLDVTYDIKNYFDTNNYIQNLQLIEKD